MGSGENGTYLYIHTFIHEYTRARPKTNIGRRKREREPASQPASERGIETEADRVGLTFGCCCYCTVSTLPTYRTYRAHDIVTIHTFRQHIRYVHGTHTHTHAYIYATRTHIPSICNNILHSCCVYISGMYYFIRVCYIGRGRSIFSTSSRMFFLNSRIGGRNALTPANIAYNHKPHCARDLFRCISWIEFYTLTDGMTQR